jgi:D-erythronate 2-dehydrogenase
MLDVLAAVGGERARALVAEKIDPVVEKIVDGWATRFDTLKAKTLGFVEDGELDGTVREFVEDYLEQGK